MAILSAIVRSKNPQALRRSLRAANIQHHTAANGHYGENMRTIKRSPAAEQRFTQQKRTYPRVRGFRLSVPCNVAFQLRPRPCPREKYGGSMLKRLGGRKQFKRAIDLTSRSKRRISQGHAPPQMFGRPLRPCSNAVRCRRWHVQRSRAAPEFRAPGLVSRPGWSSNLLLYTHGSRDERTGNDRAEAAHGRTPRSIGRRKY